MKPYYCLLSATKLNNSEVKNEKVTEASAAPTNREVIRIKHRQVPDTLTIYFHFLFSFSSLLLPPILTSMNHPEYPDMKIQSHVSSGKMNV